MLGVLLIVLSLGLLMYLAYRGMSILWISILCAGILGILSGLPITSSGDVKGILTIFGEGFGGFAGSYMLIFLTGAIFGKLMEVSGAAKAVGKLIVEKLGAKNAIAAVIISAGVLCYGGVSLFVVVFAIYPLALSLFREANITRRLIPASIAAGAFTFSMTALPGTPQIQNIIPMEYFGTTAMAAPVIGIVCGMVMMFGAIFYLNSKERKYRANGEVFDEPTGKAAAEEGDDDVPNPWLSLVPLLLVLVTLNIGNFIPSINITVEIALLIGIVFILVVFYSRIQGKIIETMNSGAAGSIMALGNTAAAVGFGSMVKAVPGFTVLKDMILGLDGAVLASEAIAVTTLAGATGSASGGLGIALSALGEQYLALGQAAGIDPQVLHRVASIACGGLDSLPHCGAVLTLLAITGMNHKKSYFDIFIVTVAIPLVATVLAVILGTVGVV
ncbi:MAG: GntP family permease [Lachnospirales bacterium]